MDEIGELSAAAQAKLLRAVQDQAVEKVGSVRVEPLDIRIISATNRPLEEAIKRGEFREDLYYRLNVVSIEIPPLRDRREDIPELVTYFINKYNHRLNRSFSGVSDGLIARMMSYHWPGNVRELEHLIMRAMVLEDGPLIETMDFTRAGERQIDGHIPGEQRSLPSILEDVERTHIKQALSRCNGVQAKAARLLGISERSLWYRIKKLGIEVR